MVVDTKHRRTMIQQAEIISRIGSGLSDSESSTIRTSSRKRRASTKHVHFSSAPVNVKAITRVPPKKEADTAQLYYTREELRKMWSRAQKTAKCVDKEVACSIDHVFDAAANSPPQHKKESVSDLYDASCRGLERFISQNLTQQRKSAVRRVLEVQATTNDATKRESLMRMRSLLVSRKAKNFAERLGAADAVDASCA